ncbi:MULTISPECIES: flagellar basal-body rod protein FlgF [unclassified Xanthobacter]|uniref:flagellar basal-body rod protein FlgF n=1 Tax=unclassified Xanthobacter TaxID=2623496 RepID=UPI001EDE8F03
MSSTVYVSLSAQMAADKRLATIANNIANLGTPGFRAEAVRFESVMSEAGGDSVAYVSKGETFTSLKAGSVTPTGNPLDMAVEGDGWFAVRTAQGTGYTRDGRLKMSPEGELRTMGGAPILDAGGAPVMIDPTGGEVRIGADGAVFQGRKAVARVGLFLLPPGATLTRHDGATVIADQPGTLVQDFTRNMVRQGYVEGANVDPVQEMTRLITLQRAFEEAASAVSQSEDATSSVIRQLGPS